MLSSVPHAGISGARLTPASLETHVITLCGDVGCRGHRERRKPVAVSADPAPIASPRPQARPMHRVDRVSNYIDQLALAGRPAMLTARQRRQVERQVARTGGVR